MYCIYPLCQDTRSKSSVQLTTANNAVQDSFVNSCISKIFQHIIGLVSCWAYWTRIKTMVKTSGTSSALFSIVPIGSYWNIAWLSGVNVSCCDAVYGRCFLAWKSTLCMKVLCMKISCAWKSTLGMKTVPLRNRSSEACQPHSYLWLAGTCLPHIHELLHRHAKSAH